MICPLCPADGRRQRSDATRHKVGQALFDLVRETGTLPDAAAVAVRAGVGRRTVFRYFQGSAALEVETARLLVKMLRAELPDPQPQGDLDARLSAFIAHRCALYSRADPVRRLIEAARAKGAPELDAFVGESVALMRGQLLGLLPELARPDLPPMALTAFELVTGWDAWDALTTLVQMPPAQVAAQMDWSARAVLAKAGIA